MVISQSDAKLLVETGPGTPMGAVFRSYWLPAFLSERLKEPDCAPISVKLLGEPLVAFRDSSGRVGLLHEKCPHRGASLTYGRCEQDGLRCIYHGWKIDVAGDVVDAPAEPRPDRFLGKVVATHYPTREAGGIVWTYMGPPESSPFPRWQFTDVPESHVIAVHYLNECNYLQAIEGDFDPAHASFLHQNMTEFNARYERAVVSRFYGFDRAPRVHNVTVPWGVDTVYRWETEDPDRPGEVDASQEAYLVQPFAAPCFSILPAYGVMPYLWHTFVPVDDHHHLVYYVHYDTEKPISAELRDQIIERFGHDKCQPENDYRPLGTHANHHLQDQKLMDDLFSGIQGIAAQDLAITQSQGLILDRSNEHLGASDAGLAFLRRYMLNVIQDVAKGDEPPRALAETGHTKLDSYVVVTPKGTDWDQVTRDGHYGQLAGAGTSAADFRPS